MPQEAVSLLDRDMRQQVKANLGAYNLFKGPLPDLKAMVNAVKQTANNTEGPETVTNRDTPAELVQVRQQWQRTSQNLMRSFPGIGVAGSLQNVAFVRAFRASGGDVKEALPATHKLQPRSP